MDYQFDRFLKIFISGNDVTRSTRKSSRRGAAARESRPNTTSSSANITPTSSPANSPRRTRRHKHADTVVPNGNLQHQASVGEEGGAELPLRPVPDSAGLESQSLLSHSPPSLSDVPSIECGSFIHNQNPIHPAGGDTEAFPQTRSKGHGLTDREVAGAERGSQDNVCVRLTDNDRVRVQADGVVNSGDSDLSLQGQRSLTPQNVASHEHPTNVSSPQSDTPPPIPPRTYKNTRAYEEMMELPLLASPLSSLATSASTEAGLSTEAATVEASVTSSNVLLPLPPSGLPARENQASFDSMEAFAGSQENLASARDISDEDLRDQQIATLENENADGSRTPGSDYQGEDGPVEGLNSEASVEPDLSDSLAEHSGGDSTLDGDDSLDSEATVNNNEGFEDRVVDMMDAHAAISSITAQLANIPSIDSAVSEMNVTDELPAAEAATNNQTSTDASPISSQSEPITSQVVEPVTSDLTVTSEPCPGTDLDTDESPAASSPVVECAVGSPEIADRSEEQTELALNTRQVELAISTSQSSDEPSFNNASHANLSQPVALEPSDQASAREQADDVPPIPPRSAHSSQVSANRETMDSQNNNQPPPPPIPRRSTPSRTHASNQSNSSTADTPRSWRTEEEREETRHHIQQHLQV